MPNLIPTETELEQVEGEVALSWAREQNALTLERLKADPRFESIYQQAKDIYESKDKIPYPTLDKDDVTNFWQDDVHVRGILRKTTFEEYQKQNPAWETILDIDALAEAEGENWVYEGGTALEPDNRHWLIFLSRGGKDATVIREFDTGTRSFVENGFNVPEAKSLVTWIDKDHLLIGSDFGEGSLTESGYPGEIRLWTRGQALSEAKTIFKGEISDVVVTPSNVLREEGQYITISRSKTFYTTDVFLMRDIDSCELIRLPVPEDAVVHGFMNGQAFVLLRSAWQVFPEGALITLDMATIESSAPKYTLVMEANDRMSINAVSITKSSALVSTTENVCGRVYCIQFNDGVLDSKQLDLPMFGSLSLMSCSNFSDQFLVNYQDFLRPSTLFHVDETLTVRELKKAPEFFDASTLAVNQYEATSTDGTKIPYFIVHPRSMQLDGTSPTLLYGYGGFEVSETPVYLGAKGKVWLEEGGVYVLANIRGGGEFGPKWHQAALKQNRQVAFDDFTSIARDLIARNITSSKHLGIMGGSNGGLLVGAAFTQNPELYQAVVCQVPLLDMMKYHTLLAGNSWMGEYGNPDDADMRESILAYSPYHHLKPEGKYPEVLFVTSTKDDRVHPYHARAMVAKMKEYGHSVLYYETIEGGHGAAANLKQYAFNTALYWTYLKQKLNRPELTLKQNNVNRELVESEMTFFSGSQKTSQIEAPVVTKVNAGCCITS